MKQLNRAWKSMTEEPDVTAVVVLVLVLGIGAGLNLQPGPEIAFSVSYDGSLTDARSFPLELPDGEFELGPLEISDRETGIGPI